MSRWRREINPELNRLIPIGSNDWLGDDMTVKMLIEILQDLNKEAEVKLWWDSAPRGDVEAIYDTCDKKTVVLAGEWGQHEHDIANRLDMDFVPVFTQDKSLPCAMIFVGWPGSRPPGQEWRDTPEGNPPNESSSPTAGGGSGGA